MTRIFVLAAVAVTFIAGTLTARAGTMDQNDSREALLAKYRCPLADMLRQVYEAPSADQERNRYLVLLGSVPGQEYVQCMFAANRTKLYCEAASGYYAQAAGKPRTHYPSDAAKAAFQRLGFATGSEQKNYPYEKDFDGVPDFNAIAALMLLAMHDGFGARADTPLAARAPFAQKVTVACVPSS